MFLAYILGSQYLCLRPKQKYLPNLFSSHYPNIKKLKDGALVPAFRVGLSTVLHLAALLVKFFFDVAAFCCKETLLVLNFTLFISMGELKKRKNAASKKWIKKKRTTLRGMDDVIYSNALDYSSPETGLFYIIKTKIRELIM